MTAASPRNAAKKRQILAAASRVFRRRGLAATGMRDIAAELGMTVGNLYYYFESKQDLLAYCQEETLVGLLARVAEARGRSLPPDAHLHLLIAGHVQHLNEEIPGSLAHLEIEALDEDRRRPLQARRDAYESAFRQVIADGVAAGVFRPVEPKVATLAILGAANWTVKWFRPGGGKSAAEIGREFAGHLVRGLLAPGVEGGQHRFRGP